MLSFTSSSPSPGHLQGLEVEHSREKGPISILQRIAAPALIALLGLAFFADLVVHPTETLYSDYSDFIPLHLPSKRFLVRSWQETGEIPRWCPYNFGGMPFVHDIQVSAFYPPHWPLYLMPEAWMGAALSWLVVLHVIAAGWCMYAYGRGHSLGRGAALVSAVGYMFAGKWLLHLLAGGHYNMVPLAWLPLLLLWLERAVERRRMRYAAYAGAVFALYLLCAYPYITLYVGLFAGHWTLYSALRSAGLVGGDGPAPLGRLVRALAWWGCTGICMAVVGVGLGAVQLLPGLEAAGQASRTTGVRVSWEMLAGGLKTAAGLVGPSLSADPNWMWEDRAAFGLLWLIAAALAPVLCRTPRVRFQAAMCGIWLGLALGGYFLFQGLPGFKLFQLPSRMLLLAAFPVALFAGITTQALVEAVRVEDDLRRRAGAIAVRLVVVAGIVTVALAGALAFRGESLRFPTYWLTLLVTVPACLWIVSHAKLSSNGVGLLWTGILLADAWAIGLPLVDTRPEAAIFAKTPVTELLSRGAGQHRVLDVNPLGRSANSTPLWPGLPAVLGIEPIRGFNPIDVLRYKEYLGFIAGHDEPLRPLDRMFTSALVGTFPVENGPLGDLLGIRYLLLPTDVPLATIIRQEDARAHWHMLANNLAATTFTFIPAQSSGADAGMQQIDPYAIYENNVALPRAFIVHQAASLPEDRAKVLGALKSTDFRSQVLLEGDVPTQDGVREGRGTASIIEYLPNRVTTHADCSSPGYLVLTDIWYPGWTCTIDGRPTAIARADYLFRAVPVPAGEHEVVFRFEPASFRWGQWISASSGLMFLGFLGFVGLSRRK